MLLLALDQFIQATRWATTEAKGEWHDLFDRMYQHNPGSDSEVFLELLDDNRLRRLCIEVRIECNNRGIKLEAL